MSSPKQVPVKAINDAYGIGMVAMRQVELDKNSKGMVGSNLNIANRHDF